jgi:predicted GTPase
MGMSGGGKSATLRAWFGQRQDCDGYQVSTYLLDTVDLVLARSHPQSIALRVIDTPGIESIQGRGQEFSRLYHTCLEQCDAILWVVAAHQPALDRTQMHLRQLPPHLYARMVFGVNQVDRIEPMDWNSAFDIPSPRQEEQIQRVVALLSASIYVVIERNPPLISYAAQRGYRLELLFHTLLERCSGASARAAARLKLLSHQDLVVRQA